MNVRALVVGALIIAIVGVAFACNRGEANEQKFDPTKLDADGGSFTKEQLLAEQGRCALTTYRAAADRAKALATALDEGGDGKAAFADAMAAFQRAEAMQFGPFAKAIAFGGKGIRDEVYTFPLFDRCRVEKALVAKTYETAELRTQKVHAPERGFDTLEYLLHDGTLSCGDTLDAGELAARRAAYAKVVAADIAARLDGLVGEWDPAGKNFLKELSTAGQGSRFYASQALALNAVMDAVFYLDAELKDDKIGAALGNAKPTLEAPYSKLGRAHVANNVAAFEALFFGCNGGVGLGFDDLLDATGAGRVSTSMRDAFAGVKTALAAIPEGRLEAALAGNTTEARAFHEALKKLATILKTEVVTVLALELPTRVEGDND